MHRHIDQIDESNQASMAKRTERPSPALQAEFFFARICYFDPRGSQIHACNQWLRRSLPC